MSSRSDWNARYRVAKETVPAPDEFLSTARRFLPQGAGRRALDLACGGGRHAVRLAQWGLATTAVDYSDEALRLCRERAHLAGVTLDTACWDLESPQVDLGTEAYDVVTVFNFLHRPLIPRMKEALKPGGMIVYKTYTRLQLRFGTGPSNPGFLLREGELRELFAEFSHKLYRERCETDATAALVAQRP